MTIPTYKLWVGGVETVIPVDPSTGVIIAHCQSASEADVDTAVQHAHDTFQSGTWSKAPRHVRADLLDRAAALLAEELPDLIHMEVLQTGRAIREMQAQVPSLVKWFRYYAALLAEELPDLIHMEVLQTGRAIREMQAQVPSLVKWFRYYAALLRTEERAVLPTMGKLHNFTERNPVGVVVQITPFNHHLLIAVKKLAPALAAGNSVILKPSELTPITSLMLANVLQRAGLPDGVFSVLPGYGNITGKALVGHRLVRKVDVTGGTAAGRPIGEIADVDAAVNGIAFGAFVASGQTCVTATRIIVHNSVLNKVCSHLSIKANSIRERMGSPMNPESMMGPVISARQLENIENLVDGVIKTGKVEAVVDGSRMTGLSELDRVDFSKGYFYSPTILISHSQGHPRAITETEVWTREIFGPVIVVVGFDTEEEAIQLANDSEFGLGAAIWTRDLSQAFRVSEQIDAGIIWVNTHHRNDPSSPWGGAKKASGLGSENGVDAYHAYTTTKSTIVNYASAEEMAADDWFREEGGSVRYG
ncbi:Aldehyde/histidinol dehydrogenase [Rhypophila decipiens]|uniref:aldehyde dehydrogenase (NAD(+)) n=1 Tax=Rhypophila decipiens TaxID=261697 RepID=A0AAN7BBE4_9PEZI|nr:Aldehyde/histidinol dehydrogenase [Rhypophila decipiens]